jgi:hypothetical protein
VTALLFVVEVTTHIQVKSHATISVAVHTCSLSVAVPGADVGPIVEERGQKVGMSRKRGPLQVKEASEKKRLGFEVQNPCNRSCCGRWPNAWRAKTHVLLSHKPFDQSDCLSFCL